MKDEKHLIDVLKIDMTNNDTSIYDVSKFDASKFAVSISNNDVSSFDSFQKLGMFSLIRMNKLFFNDVLIRWRTIISYMANCYFVSETLYMMGVHYMVVMKDVGKSEKIG